MNKFSFGLSILLLLNAATSKAQSLDQLSEKVSESKELVESERLKLEAELALKESMKLGLENVDAFNEATGLASEYGKYVAIPAAVASLYFLYQATPASLKLVNGLTPVEKLKEFEKTLTEINKEILQTKKGYESAKLNAFLNRNPGEELPIELKNKVAEAKQKYLAANGKKHLLLKVKPGVLYKTGRFVRVAAKTMIIIGTVELTASVISDVLYLWIPENKVDAFKIQLDSDIESLKLLLEDPTLQ